MPRLVLLSDTHTYLDQVDVPDGDILLHAGDISFGGEPKEIRQFNADMEKLPHKHKAFIAGNHDFLFEENPDLAKSFITSACYLRDNLVEFDGVKVYGSPWVNKYFDWAFMLPEEGLRVMFEGIPEGLDVLLTHGPPYGILDVVNRGGGHVGSKELLKAIQRAKPKIVVFGHIHEGYGYMEQDGIKYYNASINTVGYDPINSPFVVDL